MNHTARTAITIAAALLAALGFGGAAASASSTIECGSSNGYTVMVEDSTESCTFAIDVADAFPADFSGDAATISVPYPEGEPHQVICVRKYQLVIECRDSATETLIYLNSPHPGDEAG